jgi:hypothetical protein
MSFYYSPLLAAATSETIIVNGTMDLTEASDDMSASDVYLGAPYRTQSSYSRNIPLILEQYKNSDTLKKIIQISLDGKDALEDEAMRVRMAQNLETAYGVHLDDIGELCGLKRTSLVDHVYRRDLYKRRKTIYSGTNEEILLYVRSIFPNDAFIALGSLIPDYTVDAMLILEVCVKDQSASETTNALEFLESMLPAGAQLVLSAWDGSYYDNLISQPANQPGSERWF